MLRNWIRLSMIPLVALAMAITGCESGGALLGPGGGPSYSDGTTATVKYKPLKGSWSSKIRVDEKVIQPSAGGSVGIAGHVFIVPTGATTEPTLFRMEAKSATSDGSTEVIVYLTAWQKDSKGDYKVNVGANGFLKPIELRLTAEWVTDAYDASQVRIVWAKADGGQEVKYTDRAPDGRFRAYLNHFSDYVLAVP